MTKPELLRLAQYIKDEATKLPVMGSTAAMAATYVLEGIGNAMRDFANATDNLPKS